MNTTKEHTHGTHRGKHPVLTGMLILFFLSALIPSCTHDPFSPIEPDPIDTTGNPIDTTDNPGEPGEPCDPNLVYFDQQILPILKSNCAKSGCHDAITHEEDIILDSYENVMNSKENLVRPFSLNNSELYEVITENDPDDVMPPPPNQRLTSDQIQLIAKWIQQGAQDLTCDDSQGTCNTTNVSYSGFVAPLLTTYCIGCHSGGAPSGGITLNTHGGVQTVAQNGRLVGAITWASGYQQMPLGSAKLSDCNIEKIKAWVNDGAPNN